jgi:hypothetical protein
VELYLHSAIRLYGQRSERFALPSFCCWPLRAGIGTTVLSPMMAIRLIKQASSFTRESRRRRHEVLVVVRVTAEGAGFWRVSTVQLVGGWERGFSILARGTPSCLMAEIWPHEMKLLLISCGRRYEIQAFCPARKKYSRR